MRRAVRLPLWLGVLFRLSALACSMAAASQSDARRLMAPRTSAGVAPGTLLVATSRMHDADFQHAVILVIESDAHATLGLLLTRPSGFSWTKLFPALAGHAGAHEPLYLGGYVAQGLRALERVVTPSVCHECLCGGLRPLSDPVAIEARARTAPATLRLYAGYTGWSTEQLDAERAEGLWSVHSCAAETIWKTPPERLWQRLSAPRPASASRR